MTNKANTISNWMQNDTQAKLTNIGNFFRLEGDNKPFNRVGFKVVAQLAALNIGNTIIADGNEYSDDSGLTIGDLFYTQEITFNSKQAKLYEHFLLAGSVTYEYGGFDEEKTVRTFTLTADDGQIEYSEEEVDAVFARFANIFGLELHEVMADRAIYGTTRTLKLKRNCLTAAAWSDHVAGHYLNGIGSIY